MQDGCVRGVATVSLTWMGERDEVQVTSVVQALARVLGSEHVQAIRANN